MPEVLDYTSTKGAIVGFTRSLSLQLINREIRVNTVAPGPVWTPLQPASMTAEIIPKVGSQTPMGRAAQPYEIAPSYVFLACNQCSSYFSGQVLHPNGKKLCCLFLIVRVHTDTVDGIAFAGGMIVNA